MNESDLILIGAMASAIVQACKRFTPSEFLPVILIVSGAALGAAIAYGRTGEAAVLDGATRGVAAAFAAGGVYSGYKSMATGTQPRDARGRFSTKREG